MKVDIWLKSIVAGAIIAISSVAAYEQPAVAGDPSCRQRHQALSELIRSHERAGVSSPVQVAKAVSTIEEAESACEAGERARALSIYDKVDDVLHDGDERLDRSASYFD
jgi:hypothetical protein